MTENNKKILIVDDERIYIDVLVELLQPDYRVIVAKNGEQALRRAQELPIPDLILMDWLMPGMDGMEVCYRLREVPLTADIPIIFLTVKSEVEDEIKGLECGAVDYIRKPLSPPIVKARVGTQMALSQAKRDLLDYNKLLQDKVEERTAELKFRNETLNLLNDLSQRLQQTMEVAVIAQEAVRALISVSQPPQVSIYLLDEQKQTLNLIAQHGFNEKMVALAAVLPVQGSLNGQALRDRRLVICKDLENDEHIQPGMKAALLANGNHCGVVIPMVFQEQVFGTISMSYEQSGDIDHIDPETYTAIGRSVALAISNAHHFSVLEYHTLHDRLTGLPNRELLHQECARMIENVQETGDGLAMLLLDMDRFKDINDTLGHDIGDNLLIKISKRIVSALSNKNTLFSRLGGDEFALVLPISGGSDEAVTVSGQLLDSLVAPFEVGEMSLGIGASIGLAIYPEHATDSSGLLRCADVAMYQAKRTSSNVEVYDNELDQHTPERLSMIVELGAAIRDDQLVLHYQPKVNLNSQHVIGFEALVRWNHPQQGLVAPSDFIPLAEMSDQIHLLTYWVMDNALGQIKAWNNDGIDASIAINLSTRNLLDQECATKLEQLISKHAIDPSRIELEITESALMTDPERALSSLEQIANLGVSLSIDDFGTGYSSLAYLKRLPVSTLKIDRSFVIDMLKNAHDQTIVTSTINLAHSLGLKVIAEGVEDRHTMSKLDDLGCDFAQGFYISRPLETASVLEWWDNNKQA